MSTSTTQPFHRLAEGKTKIVRSTPTVVIVQSKDDITAGDGTKHDLLQGKAVAATTTTCNVFELLNRVGLVPTHYLRRYNDQSFLAWEASMIPIEVVARRRATGSYLKRNPATEEGTIFGDLVTEFFFKDDAQHDPMMVWDEFEQTFSLYDAKQPIGAAAKMGQLELLGIHEALTENDLSAMRAMVGLVFGSLERAWEAQHFALIDLKVEFGFDSYGRLMLADVIDNDSWRIWHCGMKEGMLDKQVYRDLATDDPAVKDEAMAKIGENYRRVAELTEKFLA